MSEDNHRFRNMAVFFLVMAACLQWPILRALSVPSVLVPLCAGLAILGAAFLLSWTSEAAEVDIPHGIAVALLAMVAVLPEYAVDVYFAWKAGKHPEYAPFATANMTGSNRLLIGLGWPAVLLAAWKGNGTKIVRLGADFAPELMALGAASVYAFVIPFKRSLSLLDFVVFIGIFAAYAARLTTARGEEPEPQGPAAVFAALPAVQRRSLLSVLFVFAAGTIYISAAPFADGLIHEGRRLGIDEFFLVQWVAPLASEAPEFIIAILFALKGRASTGMRMLLSSKINQWTLLIGMLPVAFAASSRGFGAMHLDSRQAHEILLTAAQSFFALAVLLDFAFSWKEAAVMAALFCAQPFFPSELARDAFSAVYVAAAFQRLGRNGGLGRLRASFK